MTVIEDRADEVRELVRRLRARERRAIALALTESERLSPRARAIQAALEPGLGHALVVGFTGPPGAGKSTLVNAYLRQLRTQGRTVAVIAVDPSSPLSA
jgi:LAO/AO transport system kinase